MKVFKLDAAKRDSQSETLGIFVSLEAAATFARDDARSILANVVFLFKDKTNYPEQMEWEELEPGYYFCNMSFVHYSIEAFDLKGLATD